MRNPYSGAIAGTVPTAGVAEVRRAIETARAYRPKLTRYERYQICYRAAGLIRARIAFVSDLITAESGLRKGLRVRGRARL